MTTEAQINANRKNAQKSTGPRTQEGKETVSQNATKHGLCSCKNVIKSESQDEYNLFHDEMIEDLSPVGAMEEMLAERIVSLSWRLKRAEVYQNAVIESFIDDRMNEKWSETRNAREQAQEGDLSLILGLAIRRDFSNSRVLDLLLQYERRIENSLYKTTAELKKIQKIRREREMIEDRRETMDEKDFVKHPTSSLGDYAVTGPTSSCGLRQTRSQSEESHPYPDKDNQDKAATQSETIDDGRRTRDEKDFVKQTQFGLDQRQQTQDIRKEVNENVKHPASSKDYLSRRSPMAKTDAVKQTQLTRTEYKVLRT